MKKENKKVNNLEVFKKVIATLLATVTIGTMSGCEGKKVPVEPTPTPGITTPVDPEPTPVEVDPNAPLFDIQDEEVFNQKAEELFNEIKGSATVFADGDERFRITDIEQAENILLFLNFESLSDEQLTRVYNKTAADNFLNYLRAPISTDFDNNESVEYSKYVSNAQIKAEMQRVEVIAQKYLDNNKELYDTLTADISNEIDAVKNSDNTTNISTYYTYTVLFCLDYEYYKRNGETEKEIETYSLISDFHENFVSNKMNELGDELIGTSKGY